MLLKSKKEKGITLVALVITIIILLILAGISIAQLVGSGLFEKARKAEKESKEGQELENTILEDYEDTIEEYLEPNVPAITVAEAQSDEMLKKTINTKVQDVYGNQIIVPAGFKITNDATTANNGIVIIDKNENEFVWIPVPIDGKVYTNLERTQYKIVQLNRYTFDENGIKTSHNEQTIEPDYQELSTSNRGNTIAKSIHKFKRSVSKNKGYYIGRYEARTETARTAQDAVLTPITLKVNDYIYNYITQPQAAEKCRNMYDSTKPFTSDLMNSYAWDTAILFLQECGTNPKYSRQITVNTTLATTGTNNQEIKDIQCNVHDMSSNLGELTTETSSDSSLPCVVRGGYILYNHYYASSRLNCNTSYSVSIFGFRPILYL